MPNHSHLGLLRLPEDASEIRNVADPATLDDGLHHHEDSDPLFDRFAGPSKEDIVQGGVGDCYFLAALISILDEPELRGMQGHNVGKVSGSEYVETLMLDEGPTIVVRFFRKDPPNATGAAARFRDEYIRIQKTYVRPPRTLASILGNGTNPPRSTGAKWVRYMEKAWAAYLCGGVLDANYYKLVEPDQAPYYQGVRLASANGALEALTGKPSDDEAPVNCDSKQLPWMDVPTAAVIVPEQRTAVFALRSMELLVTPAFQGRWSLLNEWWQFFAAHINAAMTAGKTAELLERGPRIKRERFTEIARAGYLNVGLAARLAELLPGKRGTGVYTAQQLSIFDRIRRALAAGQVIIAPTRNTVGRQTGQSHSAGEPMARGLIGKHAYSVLEVATEMGASELRWIKLRNPHGSTGRRYELHSDPNKAAAGVLRAVETEEGEFWLELSDLTKRFDALTFGLEIR